MERRCVQKGSDYPSDERKARLRGSDGSQEIRRRLGFFRSDEHRCCACAQKIKGCLLNSCLKTSAQSPESSPHVGLSVSGDAARVGDAIRNTHRSKTAAGDEEAVPGQAARDLVDQRRVADGVL